MVFAALVLTVLALGAAALWWRDIQRVATEQAVTKDLDEATFLEKQEQWDRALEVLERAKVRLAGSGPGALQARVTERRRNAAMVISVAEAQLQASGRAEDQQKASGHSSEGKRDYGVADRTYEKAFAEIGLDVKALPAEEIARQIKDSAIRAQLVRA